MRIGVPTEIKPAENRVALTPAGARELTSRGHEVLVQAGAGEGSSLPDEVFVAAGAKILPEAAEVWGRADLVVKVKEPLASEYGFLRPDLTLVTYLHLAASAELTEALATSGCVAVAYETVEDGLGRLPLLVPMSEIAGRMAVQVGAHHLERHHGGSGTLLGGVPGVAPGRVLVIGAGTSGENAAFIAAGMGADTTVVDLRADRLRELERSSGGRIRTLMSTRLLLEQQVAVSDLVIGAVLLPGGRAPTLIDRSMLATMREGSVFVDIAIDQGGCAETSRLTTHDGPTFVENGVVHYCVGNMPGAVPRTATVALTNVTLPVLLRLADGVQAAVAEDPGLLAGINVHRGAITNAAVARAHGLDYTPVTPTMVGSGA